MKKGSGQNEKKIVSVRQVLGSVEFVLFRYHGLMASEGMSKLLNLACRHTRVAEIISRGLLFKDKEGKSICPQTMSTF
jgi:hypothetical protein